MKVAALFVDPAGMYSGLPDVEAWGEDRDARKYAGPWPVVAHPPCNRWAMPMAKVNQTRYGHKIGDDGGCFDHALWCVQMFGGVLEHPAATWAWKAFGLRRPERGRWVTAGIWWVTEVSQSAYGCKARKRTWLFANIRGNPPELDWSDLPGTHAVSWLHNPDGTRSTKPRISKREASATPPAFRDVLLAIARSAIKGHAK